MRKRLGAIHSDSTEEYIQLAQTAWNKDLFYYEGNSKKQTQNIGNFDFDERETNNTEIEEEIQAQIQQMEAQNVKILVMNIENEAQYIFDYCGQEYHQKKDFDYISKIEINKNKQITYHFWMNNLNSTKFTDIIDVYVKNCDVVIYVYNKLMEEHYQEFVQKISKINNKNFIIYKVKNIMNRTQSYNTLNDQNKENVISVKSLQEAISKTINQYI
ncbi:unnamed protein product [Paramecium pentaurelia]|uniref:Uncharacterized protein n=1 Tax=Paramecium pentaurelia TaxID=43138 RepID=A0A8S1XGZ2_9CILI|nr:unnamed protein product [Paramecium pentaurelia]